MASGWIEDGWRQRLRGRHIPCLCLCVFASEHDCARKCPYLFPYRDSGHPLGFVHPDPSFHRTMGDHIPQALSNANNSRRQCGWHIKRTEGFNAKRLYSYDLSFDFQSGRPCRIRQARGAGDDCCWRSLSRPRATPPKLTKRDWSSALLSLSSTA